MKKHCYEAGCGCQLMSTELAYGLKKIKMFSMDCVSNQVCKCEISGMLCIMLSVTKGSILNNECLM